MIIGKRFLYIVLCVSGLAGCTKPLTSEIFIDTAEEYQTISGWEVTARTWEYDKVNDRFNSSWEESSNKIFEELVNKAGINRIRLALKSGFENPVDYWSQFADGEIGYLEYKAKFYEKINDNNDPYVINSDGFNFAALDYVVESMVLPMQKLLEERGERLIINLCYIDFKHSDKTSTLKHALNPEEYAEFVLASFQHLRDKYAIEPDFFELILEPDNTLDWRGNNIGNAIVSVANRLHANNFSPKLIAPATSRLYEAHSYFDEMIEVDGVEGFLDTYAYHRYATNVMPEWVEQNFLRGIHSRSKRYGLRSSMLEYLKADINDLFDDLTIANITGWQIWSIAYKVNKYKDQKGTMLLVDANSDLKNPDIRLTNQASLMAPLFRNVREGAIRIGSSVNGKEHKVAAFKNRNGSISLLAYFAEEQTHQILVYGVPKGQYAFTLTHKDGSTEVFEEQETNGGKPLNITFSGSGTLSMLSRRE